MKRLSNLIFGAILIAVIAATAFKLITGPDAPCSSPIAYDIGSFDSRFGISREYFLSALRDAEAIWEKPTGIDLFKYSPGKGELKVDLVYDYRQEATSKLKDIGLTVQDSQASYDMLKAKHNALKYQYASAKSAYDARVKSFNQRNDAYNKTVRYWNARGGAPHEEYAKTEAERVSLQNESAAIESDRLGLNATVDDMNALVVGMNRIAATLNLTVEKYNTVNTSLGESFEEGLYQSTATSQSIDIYEFTDRNKLVRVLAHELGHALGLGHVSDQDAIMYKANKGTQEALTEDDLAALTKECKLIL